MTQRRALVTGGSGDIGGAICRQLAADGLHVIVHANANIARAESVVGEIHAVGGSAQAVAFDVADGDATRTAIDALLADGPIQVVVNNAGIHDDAPMAGMSAEHWKRVVDVSLHGYFHVTHPLLLPMARTRWGRIVSVSSWMPALLTTIWIGPSASSASSAVREAVASATSKATACALPPAA